MRHGAPRRSSLADVPAGRARSNYAGERADLALQLADRSAPTARRRSSSTGVYRDAGAAAHSGARRRWSARASGSTAPALAAQSQRVEQELAARSAQIFELAGERVQHQLAASSCRRSSSTSCSCRRCKRNGEDEDARRRRSTCSRSSRSRTICRG